MIAQEGFPEFKKTPESATNVCSEELPGIGPIQNITSLRSLDWLMKPSLIFGPFGRRACETTVDKLVAFS
jgi:hypothetical protein